MTVGIVGIGLIGGSLAGAYSKAGHTVMVCEKDRDMLDLAMASGAAHAELTDESLPRCELVLLAIYPDACVAWLEAHAPLLRCDALVLDCCGVKQAVCAPCFALAERYGFTFVGAHPMAGTHFSGFPHSRADLFRGAPMVLVPPRSDDVTLLHRVRQALAPCRFGSFCVTTAQEHDRLIAYTSQLPHIVSNAFVKSPTASSHHGYSAGSYRDLTRVAWLNAPMWTELFLKNRAPLLDELDGYIRTLGAYRDALEREDRDALCALLEAGKRRKEEIDG